MAKAVTKPINCIRLLVNIEKSLMLLGFWTFGYAFSHCLITPMYVQKRTEILNPYALAGLLVGYFLITLAVSVRIPQLYEKGQHNNLRKYLNDKDDEIVMQRYSDRIMWLIRNDEELKIIRERRGWNSVETKATFEGLNPIVSIEKVDQLKPSKSPNPAHAAQTIETDRAKGDGSSKDERMLEGIQGSDDGEDNDDTWSGRPNSAISHNDIRDEAMSIANDEFTRRQAHNAALFKSPPTYATTRSFNTTSAFTDGSTGSPSKSSSNNKKAKRAKEASRKAAQKKRKQATKKEVQVGALEESDPRYLTAEYFAQAASDASNVSNPSVKISDGNSGIVTRRFSEKAGQPSNEAVGNFGKS